LAMWRSPNRRYGRNAFRSRYRKLTYYTPIPMGRIATAVRACGRPPSDNMV